MLPTTSEDFTPKFFEDQYPHTGDCQALKQQIMQLYGDANKMAEMISHWQLSPVKKPVVEHLKKMIKAKEEIVAYLKCGTANEIKPSTTNYYDVFLENAINPSSAPAKAPVAISEKTKAGIFLGIIAIAAIVGYYYLTTD